MDRDIVLVVFILVLCGAPALGFGSAAFPTAWSEEGRRTERRCWMLLWCRLLPSAILLSGLVGWSLQEPDHSDERVTAPLVLLASFFALVWLRATWRAARSMAIPVDRIPAAAIGLFRPRVFISSEFRTLLAPNELRAVRAHEASHVRHRDPLRVWLAQFATDLQWPSPWAPRRLRDWLQALELARDREAVAGGIRAVDLAAALVTAVRLRKSSRAGVLAGLLDDEQFLRMRVGSLLTPCSEATIERPGVFFVPHLVTILLIVVAGLLGAAFGDVILRAIPGIGI